MYQNPHLNGDLFMSTGYSYTERFETDTLNRVKQKKRRTAAENFLVMCHETSAKLPENFATAYSEIIEQLYNIELQKEQLKRQEQEIDMVIAELTKDPEFYNSIFIVQSNKKSAQKQVNQGYVKPPEQVQKQAKITQ